MHQTIYVPEATAHGPSYAVLGRRQTVQHAVALLARWLHDHDEKEIADAMGITEADVRRDLEWALDLIDRRRGERPAEMPVVDEMPATICSQCNDAIPSGEYRVAIIAAACSYRPDDVTWDYSEMIEAERTLIFCGDCAMSMPQFTIINDFKREVEIKAKWAASPPVPGEDALQPGRAITGHGGKYENLDGEAFHSSDVEANAYPDRSGMVPTAPRSEESVRRETLGRFLSDRARSWGKLRPRQREVVKLYVGGLTQSEIGRRVGLDQANVSRMIQFALNLAR